MSVSETRLANEMLIRNLYEDMSQGGNAAVLGLLTEDIEWIVPGRTPGAGHIKGMAALHEHFALRAPMYEGVELTIELIDVLSSEERVAAIINGKAVKGNRVYEGRSMHVYEIVDGRIASFWNLAGDVYAEDEFFLHPQG